MTKRRRKVSKIQYGDWLILVNDISNYGAYEIKEHFNLHRVEIAVQREILRRATLEEILIAIGRRVVV